MALGQWSELGASARFEQQLVLKRLHLARAVGERFDARGECLYSVHGDKSDISAFRIDPHSGKLTQLNRQSTGGKNPVHLAIDPNGCFVVVSNHASGTLSP